MNTEYKDKPMTGKEFAEKLWKELNEYLKVGTEFSIKLEAEKLFEQEVAKIKANLVTDEQIEDSKVEKQMTAEEMLADVEGLHVSTIQYANTETNEYKPLTTKQIIDIMHRFAEQELSKARANVLTDEDEKAISDILYKEIGGYIADEVHDNDIDLIIRKVTKAICNLLPPATITKEQAEKMLPSIDKSVLALFDTVPVTPEQEKNRTIEMSATLKAFEWMRQKAIDSIMSGVVPQESKSDAVEFAEWIYEKRYKPTSAVQGDWYEQETGRYLTSEELYKKFNEEIETKLNNK